MIIAHDISHLKEWPDMNALRKTVVILWWGLLALSPVVARDAVSLEGPTLDGKPFSLVQVRGQVVMLMYWSTDCAVCRDKMPELRQNVEGWRDKPFRLVLVSTDRKLQDLMDYESVLVRTVPRRQQFVQLWSGAAGFRDSVVKPGPLPLTLLIDKSGKVVERYRGRISPEVWDRIADLL
jgi:thiol-disulfide isomerase/thioredoxin